ncbi:MAG: DegV family protein [Oscillospiraceae bacterium]
MRKVAVLTDSASDIPQELAKASGVDIMNFDITLDGKSYEERVDFTFDEYYDMLKNAQGMPSTAHITSLRFLEKYCEYADDGYTDIVHITINAGGSATHDAALMAKEQLKDERHSCKMKIHIIDSHTYSMTYGYYVCEAARHLRNGAELKQVLAGLDEIFGKVEIALSVYSLRFIKKSGRISAAAAFAGELLGLRPIISMIDGETTVCNKVRGDKNILPALISRAQTRRLQDSKYMVGTTDMQNGEELAAMCKKAFGAPPECIFKLGAAVSTNTGPDAIAIVYEGEQRRNNNEQGR